MENQKFNRRTVQNRCRFERLQKSAGKVRNGSQFVTLPALLQIHKKTEFSGAERLRISQVFLELYEKGLSLTDISRQTGKAKNTIRDTLSFGPE